MRWLLLPISPTRLAAETLIDNGWLVEYGPISNWNYVFLTIAALTCFCFFWWPSQNISQWTAALFTLLAWISLSRVVELIVAFYRDALQRFWTTERRTKLKPDERIWLLIRAYLELIIQFGIIQYWIGCIRGASAFEKPLSSIWASLYFSGMTITTTGYGDVAPVDPLARATALAESVSGVFFIALSLAAYLSAAVDPKPQSDTPSEEP